MTDSSGRCEFPTTSDLKSWALPMTTLTAVISGANWEVGTKARHILDIYCTIKTKKNNYQIIIHLEVNIYPLGRLVKQSDRWVLCFEWLHLQHLQCHVLSILKGDSSVIVLTVTFQTQHALCLLCVISITFSWELRQLSQSYKPEAELE